MNIRCEQIDDLLLEGDAYSMSVAAKHAGSCEACRRLLGDWNDISRTAKLLHVTWKSDLLWPRIRKSVGGSHLWRAAAAAVLTIGIGATSWYAVRDTTRDSLYEQKILNVAAVDEVERAEAAYVAAIDQLETVAEADLDRADLPVMVSYREKLMLLDDAIAEVQAGIEQNRQNAHLRRQLLAMYSEKHRTLQEVVREGDHVRSE